MNSGKGRKPPIACRQRSPRTSNRSGRHVLPKRFERMPQTNAAASHQAARKEWAALLHRQAVLRLTARRL
eukprot:1338895-Alexandrium_andersonii.AAC.1